jgi:hypothetical protein
MTRLAEEVPAAARPWPPIAIAAANTIAPRNRWLFMIFMNNVPVAQVVLVAEAGHEIIM